MLDTLDQQEHRDLKVTSDTQRLLERRELKVTADTADTSV
jgi:hypothetical protein